MLIVVTLMLTVPTLRGTSPVPVTLDTVGMASLAMAGKTRYTSRNAYPLLSDVDECTTDADNCDTNADCTNTEGNFTCA